jgi:hypothetical protein
MALEAAVRRIKVLMAKKKWQDRQRVKNNSEERI